MYKLSLAHLYPKLLNISGDIGNIVAFKKRCEWRDIELEITEINTKDEINVEKYDIYFIGGGEDTQQELAIKELSKYKESFSLLANKGTIFLGICGGYQLLGKYFENNNKDKIEGLGLLDIFTISGEKRFTGNVTTKSNIDCTSQFVGFENHIGQTYLENTTKPLGTVSVGNGNNGKDKTEGARKNNVFGTYLHGSLLPKNPHFADLLISLALQNKYGETKLEPLNDSIELAAHNSVIGKQY